MPKDITQIKSKFHKSYLLVIVAILLIAIFVLVILPKVQRQIRSKQSNNSIRNELISNTNNPTIDQSSIFPKLKTTFLDTNTKTNEFLDKFKLAGGNDVTFSFSFNIPKDYEVRFWKEDNISNFIITDNTSELKFKLFYAGTYTQGIKHTTVASGTSILTLFNKNKTHEYHIAKAISEDEVVYLSVNCNNLQCDSKAKTILDATSYIPATQIPGGLLIDLAGKYENVQNINVFDAIIKSIDIKSKVNVLHESDISLVVDLNEDYKRYINFQNGFQVTFPVKTVGINKCIKDAEGYWSFLPNIDKNNIVDVIVLEDNSNNLIYFTDKTGAQYTDNKPIDGSYPKHIACQTQDTSIDTLKSPKNGDTYFQVMNMIKFKYGKHAAFNSIFEEIHGPGCKEKASLDEAVPFNKPCPLNYVYVSEDNKDSDLAYTYIIGQQPPFQLPDRIQDFYTEVIPSDL